MVGVNVEPLHVAGLQTWSVPTFLQAPVPSQNPSLPHSFLAVSSTQLLRESFLPLLTAAHSPSALPVNDFLHEKQASVQALSQQIWSTQ
jgi:hypothetical protein